MRMILARYVLQKFQSHLSQCRFEVKSSTFVFYVFCLQFGILPNHRCPSVKQNELDARRPCIIDHLFFTSDFRQVPRWNLFQFLSFFIHCCFCCGNLHGLRHRNKWSKPTLAKPTLAKVKVSVVCKDFGFWELICLGFLKLIVQFFFCRFCFCLLGGWMLESPAAIFHRKGGDGEAPRVGTQTQKKWGFEGWGSERWGVGASSGGSEGWEAQNFAFFFHSPVGNFTLFSPWGSSRGLLVVFEAPGRSNVHVWSSLAVVWNPGGYKTETAP